MEQLIADEVDQLCSHLESASDQGAIPISVEWLYTVAVVNALWRILTGERLDYEDEKIRSVVTTLEDFASQLSSPLNQVAISVPMIMDVLCAMGFDCFRVRPTSTLLSGIPSGT